MNERLKAIRKELNLTQKEFATKIGITNSGISRLEKGENRLTEQLALSICREYNVNYDWLMTGNGEMFSSAPLTIVDELCSQYNLDDLDRAILEEYIKLDADERAIIKEYIQGIINRAGRAGKQEEMTTEAAEAAYREALGIAPPEESIASNTIEDIQERKEAN